MTRADLLADVLADAMDKAAAIVEAHAKAMDKAAAIVEAHAKAAKNCANEGGLIRPIREAFLRKHFALMEAAKDIRQHAAAIRARMEDQA